MHLRWFILAISLLTVSVNCACTTLACYLPDPFDQFTTTLLVPLMKSFAPASENEMSARKANDAWLAAANQLFVPNGNISAMEKAWQHSDSVTFLPPYENTIITGWKNIRTYFLKEQKAGLRGSITLDNVGVHLPLPDVAVVTAIERGNLQLSNGEPLSLRIRSTNVYVKVNNQWLLHSRHADYSPELASKVPAMTGIKHAAIHATTDKKASIPERPCTCFKDIKGVVHSFSR